MNEENKREAELREAVNADFKKEIPSSNFTHLVMQKVEATELKKAAHQKPLVGFVGWLIFGAFALLMVFALFAQGESSFKLELPDINMKKFWSTYSLIPLTLFAIAILIFADTMIRKKRKKTA
ncbi:MAG: hypothetical protein BM555_02970 [Crocinitomix sp. MedPE-SWsnd]|nr:MAG: hypothetical protein BM555_02970 [Crocinitomix sp. MedPE-SWsnd]